MLLWLGVPGAQLAQQPQWGHWCWRGWGGLTGEAVKSVGAGASKLMLHFPNTAKKVPQNRPRYPDWAGKCSKLIPELGPSALAHLSEHPVPGAAHQSEEIRHFCIPYGIPGSVEP